VGLGPAFTLPTASDKRLGTGKWSAGPAAVVLTIEGPWVVGTRINNQWSFVGNRGRADVNEFLLQPFAHYNFRHGWYVARPAPAPIEPPAGLRVPRRIQPEGRSAIVYLSFISFLLAGARVFRRVLTPIRVHSEMPTESRRTNAAVHGVLLSGRPVQQLSHSLFCC
jgi:hypothetical protein